MIMAGIFPATVIGQSWTRSYSGTVGLRLTVRLESEMVDGETMTGTIWLSETPKGSRASKAQLKNLGVDWDNTSFRSISVLNVRCRVDIREEDYQGEKQLKIGFFLPLEESLQEAELDALEKKVRAASSKPVGKPTAKATPLPPLTTAATGDDIPF